MELNAHESTRGWRWTVDQDDKDNPAEMVGSSNQHFPTEQEALENAKYLALGILDAFASAMIETHALPKDITMEEGDGS